MNEPQNLFLCCNCAKDIFLKKYIITNAKCKEECIICLSGTPTIDIINDKLVVQFCRFLIRYHFSEWDYNTHVGGEDLPSQFYKENPILKNDFKDYANRELEIEYFLYTLFGIWNEKNMIEVYQGFDSEGTRFIFQLPIKEEKSKTWYHYKKELANKNYFLLEEKAKETFMTLLIDLKSSLPPKTKFYRARIGYNEETHGKDLLAYKTKASFKNREISCPLPNKAKAGRANRQGVSFLYLSSTKETALGEVRPHPGHYVSLGGFENDKRLRLADLRSIDPFNYFHSDERIETFKFLNDISEELSIPILPEEQENYLVTQFISDIIRQLGFHGILFNSSVTEGFNLVAFDPAKFNFCDDNSELIKVTAVNFKYKKVEYNVNEFFGTADEK